MPCSSCVRTSPSPAAACPADKSDHHRIQPSWTAGTKSKSIFPSSTNAIESQPGRRRSRPLIWRCARWREPLPRRTELTQRRRTPARPLDLRMRLASATAGARAVRAARVDEPTTGAGQIVAQIRMAMSTPTVAMPAPATKVSRARRAPRHTKTTKSPSSAKPSGAFVRIDDAVGILTTGCKKKASR